MGWAIGYDGKWKRDIGYGVPAYCDHPGCWRQIDRGLDNVCGGAPHGGVRGCGLYFCSKHRRYHARLPQLCARCERLRPPFKPVGEHPHWIAHKLTDSSWQDWRDQNPAELTLLIARAAEWLHPLARESQLKR